MADQALQEETTLEVSGVRVYCQRRGQGPPLLLLHAEDAASQWRPFHALLARQFEVILPDHPGFGRSEALPWLRGMPDLVYWYLDFLDQLGLERVHVVGESFGGWLAATLAVVYSHRLERLVLIGPAGVKPRGVSVPDLFAMSPAEWAATTLHAPERVAAGSAERPNRATLERQLRDKATLARLAWNPYLHDPQLPHWLHRVRVPTLLIWGRYDRLLPPALADHWLRRLPDARLVTIEAAGHFPQIERPDVVAATVSDFLQGE